MERVAPPQLNYDDILPLAIESRSNRREFLPVNGATFSNATGATICRIDVNADSMLDASHSYLECDITNNHGTADTFLALNPFCPSWIQRLRIESGGVVIEDINEYSRLYAMLVLNQTPESYVRNNVANQGMYKPEVSLNLQWGTPATVASATFGMGLVASSTAAAAAFDCAAHIPTELHYPMSAQTQLKGVNPELAEGDQADSAVNRPDADGLLYVQRNNRIFKDQSSKMCIPLVSGFLNMDQYIPLIMMNAGFTIELTLCDANRIGVTQIETAADQGAFQATQAWTVSGIKYVAHLIDLDRSFYDRLRAVMEGSGGVLQLAGQTYRHFVGQLPVGTAPVTITLPARVKSVKSIFGTFIATDVMGVYNSFDTSVFHNANIDTFRFEIGSVRYPQTEVQCRTTDAGVAGLAGVECQVELQKAWGKLGDYNHEQAYTYKHLLNVEDGRNGSSPSQSVLSAFCVGYDFEAFQRVALEAGINTADRSLPINFIVTQHTATTAVMRADFFILTDALYYINLDGTVSVSV